MKQMVIGLVVGLVLGGSATGYAVTKGSTPIRIGDGVTLKAIDAYCWLDRSDPNGEEAGPILDCGRTSTNVAGSTCPGRHWVISRYHILVQNFCHGPVTTSRFNRNP